MIGEQGEQPRPKRGFNWLGLVAFIVIAFGARIVSFAQWLFAGGAALLPGSFNVPLLLGGGAALAVIVALAVTLRAARSGGPRPNAPLPPFGGPGAQQQFDPAPADAPMLPPVASQPLPSAPRFEPIISARVAVALALAALALGGAVAVYLFVTL